MTNTDRTIVDVYVDLYAGMLRYANPDLIDPPNEWDVWSQRERDPRAHAARVARESADYRAGAVCRC